MDGTPRPRALRRRIVTASLLLAAAMAVIAAAAFASGTSARLRSHSATQKYGPLKIVGIYDVKGQDPVTPADISETVQYAVKVLNAHGGVGGRRVQLTRLPEGNSSGDSPTVSNTSLIQAYEKHPSGIVSDCSTAAFAPLMKTLAKGSAPAMCDQTTTELLTPLSFPNNVFSVRADTAASAGATATYLMKKYHATKVGLICVAGTFGTDNCDADQAAIKAAGGTVIARVTSSPTSTNETTEAAAMQGAQLVLDEGYPAPIIEDIKAMAADGINVPVSGGASASFAAQSGGLTSTQLGDFYGFEDCNPASSSKPAAQNLVKAIKSESGITANFIDAELYDSVMMLAKAAEAAHSVTPAAIAKQLRKLTYSGICTKYHSGHLQIMNDSTGIVSFANGVGGKIVASVTT